MLFPVKVHRFFFLFGIISLAFGMMMGAVPTSVPQFVLLINWLLEGQFKHKWQTLKFNKLFWLLEVLFLIHVLGLVYSENLKAGLSDVQIKLPLMILPLVLFSTKSLNAKEIRFTLFAFLLGCLVNTGWCLLYSFFLHHEGQIRNTSRFMSHIRLGLYLNMAIVICLFFYRSFKEQYLKFSFLLLVIYFVFVMYSLGLASGLSILFILAFIFCIVIVFRQKWIYKLSTIFVFSAFSYLAFDYVKDIMREQFVSVNSPNNKPLKQSGSGRNYIHFDTLSQKENGNYIYMNIQLEELKQGWKKRCPEDSFSFPPHAHNLARYNVLLRYLASKGLNKDSVGVTSLSDLDLISIKQNISNSRFKDWSFLHQRIYELVNEYENFISERNINGQSVTMRFYFWKAAIFSIREHPLIGVGSGDVQSQMDQTYIQSKSPLKPEWYKRPHNQFLTIAVAFGLTGLCIVLFSLFYPMLLLRNELSILYFTFTVICFISFLSEDTIETQAGATFYAFFNTFFITNAYFKKQQNPAG